MGNKGALEGGECHEKFHLEFFSPFGVRENFFLGGRSSFFMEVRDHGGQFFSCFGQRIPRAHAQDFNEFKAWMEHFGNLKNGGVRFRVGFGGFFRVKGTFGSPQEDRGEAT